MWRYFKLTKAALAFAVLIFPAWSLADMYGKTPGRWLRRTEEKAIDETRMIENFGTQASFSQAIFSET